MATLYRIRGTKRSMVELLRISTRVEKVKITDDGSKPHFFEVQLKFIDGFTSGQKTRLLRLAEAIIDLEKPAYTYYSLKDTKRI